MLHPSAHIVNAVCPVLSINPHTGSYLLTGVLIDGTVVLGNGATIEEAMHGLHLDCDRYAVPFNTHHTSFITT